MVWPTNSRLNTYFCKKKKLTKKTRWLFTFKAWVIIMFTLPLSSCFEVIHELNLNADGSGHVEFVLNFSRSETKIQLLKLLDEVNGYKIPTDQEIHEQVASFADSARVSPGIKNVYSRYDERSYSLEFKCDFDRVERLNDRIYSLWQQKEPTKAVREKYCTFVNNELTIRIGARIMTLFKQMKPADRDVLIGADYTSIMRFEKEVLSQTNKGSKLIPNKKVIIIESPILDLIQEPYLFNNLIKIKA